MNEDDEDLPEGEAEDEANLPPAPESPRSAKSRIALEQEQARHFWRAVFSDPVGRREMWGLLTAAHTFEERFACGPTGFPQPEATWFHAGEQAIGLRLYHTWLAREPQGVIAMQFEHDHRFPKPTPPKRKRGQT